MAVVLSAWPVHPLQVEVGLMIRNVLTKLLLLHAGVRVSRVAMRWSHENRGHDNGGTRGYWDTVLEVQNGCQHGC